MSKPVITRLFVGGLVAMIAGLIVAMFAGLAAFAGSEVTVNGREVTAFHATPLAMSMIALAILGGLAIAGGAVAGLVAWIGALINTAQLDDKLWFIVLLVTGLLSFGLIAMIAYVIAGPDSATLERRGPVQPVTWEVPA
jgi:hypothetical protein